MKQKIFYLLFLVSLLTMPALGKGGLNESRSACSINVTVNSTPYYCVAEGGTATATASGGTAPYIYMWSNGQTTSSIMGLSAGTYSVIVQDSLGCTGTGNSVIKADSLRVYAYGSTTVEPGDSAYLYIYLQDLSGSSSYSGSYTVSWSPSSTAHPSDTTYTYVRPTTTTTYSVTVTTPCHTYVDTVTVFTGCNVSATVQVTPYFCSSVPGAATVNASGGESPYTYSWSSGQTTSSANNLTAGTYSVTVKDSIGCSAIETFSVATGKMLVDAYSSTKIEAGDSANLYVYVNDSGSGTSSYSGSYTVSWSPAASVTNPTAQSTYGHPTATTTYTVNITTPCGTYSDTVTIYVGCNTSVYVSTTPYYCSASEGTATGYPSGGIAPYTYAWSSGQTSSSITGIAAGTYSLTVTDSKGCMGTATYTIITSTVKVNAYAFPQSINLGDSTYLYLYVNDSTSSSYSSSYTVAWSPSASVTYPDTTQTYAHPSVTTTYTVTITTACGTSTDTVTVYVNTPCVNSFDQDICIVTTDTAINKNVIIWGRNNSPPDGYFNIYDSTSSGWVKIGSVLDTALSEFIDTASQPNTQPYSYKISTVDSCGESALSPVNSSIYLQVIIGTGSDTLRWTPYVGFVTPIYYIFRGPSINALKLIDSVSGSILSYIDNSPPAGSMYLIEAVNPSGGCVPTHRFVSRHTADINTKVSFSNGGIPHKPTGIDNIMLAESSLIISPNPANGVFSVNYTLLKDQEVTINVIDEFGRIVYEKKIFQHAGNSKQYIDISSVAEGIYSLRMITSEGIMVRKVVTLKN